jgi:hypothetical protein
MSRPFEDAIVRAFQGGKEAGGYLATGEDLGIQLESLTVRPRRAAATNARQAFATRSR